MLIGLGIVFFVKFVSLKQRTPSSLIDVLDMYREKPRNVPAWETSSSKRKIQNSNVSQKSPTPPSLIYFAGIVLVCRIRFTSNEDYVRFIHKLISLNEVEYQMDFF